MKWIIILILLLPGVHAKVWAAYPPVFQEHIDYRSRILQPHIYPGMSFTTGKAFMEEPLRPGTTIVRWTDLAGYGIKLDRVHLERKSYTLRIKSRYGWQIRALPFETTKLYLAPDYYKIRIDKKSQTVWLAKYVD